MYDLVVVGGGPGGYVAAIRGAQAGLKTALVEKEALGGTCLNKGCIPTKCLVHDVNLYDQSRKSRVLSGREHLQIDLDAAVNRKRQVVDRLVGGVASLLKKQRVEVFKGTAKLIEPGRIRVDGGQESSRTLEASWLILATGSRPSVPGFIDVDGYFVQTTDQALEATKVPRQVVIIGAGVIGMEMAGIYSRIGAGVSIVEMLPDILPGEDRDIRKVMTRELKKAKIRLHLGATVREVNGQHREVRFQDNKGEEQVLACDLVIVATGRSPVMTGLEAVEPGLDMEGPFIRVDAFQRSNLPGVYAIGDVVGGMMLAHKASAEAEVAVDHILGKKKRLNHRNIPRCVWGLTEIGAVGLSEEEAIEAGYVVKTGTFPVKASGAAQAMDSPQGMVKIVGQRETGEILGVHIIGPRATDLIAEAATTMSMEGAVEDLYETVKPHPTLSEAVMEAAMDWNTRAIHKTG
ncbi:MAG: dihydrolipoyl dehydrogenase [Desulfohalobiaceae bacterium]|nr:dihydrolipoyl dehydrogenase [Desulfohalobiaceae bacterium]